MPPRRMGNYALGWVRTLWWPRGVGGEGTGWRAGRVVPGPLSRIVWFNRRPIHAMFWVIWARQQAGEGGQAGSYRLARPAGGGQHRWMAVLKSREPQVPAVLGRPPDGVVKHRSVPKPLGSKRTSGHPAGEVARAPSWCWSPPPSSSPSLSRLAEWREACPAPGLHKAIKLAARVL